MYTKKVLVFALVFQILLFSNTLLCSFVTFLRKEIDSRRVVSFRIEGAKRVDRIHDAKTGGSLQARNRSSQ